MAIIKERSSITYKLKAPQITDHAVYFTIVGIGEDAEAFFINSKEMESFQWIIALMTSYSRQIKAGVSVDSIIKDMLHTFDPGGAYFLEDGSGRKVNSLVHHLGLILQQHIRVE